MKDSLQSRWAGYQYIRQGKRLCGLSVLLLAGLLSVVVPGGAAAEHRTWTSRTGNTVDAEWVGENNGTVMLRKVDGKTVGIAISALSDDDQIYLKNRKAASSATLAPAKAVSTAPSAAAAAMTLGGVNAQPGKLITFLATLPSDAVRALKKEKNTEVTQAMVGVAVPENFDPAKQWNVFIVSATSDGNALSVNHLKQYMKEALAQGWVLMAADGPSGEAPEKNSNTWRWSLIRAGLEEMHRAWPASRTWPYAAGGFSGGAKRSGYIAALLASEDYRVIGMFMGGCNQDMASLGLQEYSPKRSAFQRVPIFISSGTSDTVATEAASQRVRDSMRKTGFKDVRIEAYAGGHDLFPPHTGMALAWFEDLAQKH